MRDCYTLWMVVGILGLMPQSQQAAPLDSSYHTTMCDASAGAILTDNLFVVANDEDNSLRIYRSDVSGGPVSVTDLSQFLRVDQDHPESDIEGAAWLGKRIYWVTSHGRNKDGKYRKSRNRFFATDVKQTPLGIELVPVLKPYKHLLRDLLKERQLRGLGLLEGSQLAPKDEGGLNIESLCQTPQGQFLIGFRNPIPQGRGLVVPFLNPEGVLEGQSAQFGEPILLELGGYGIRDMAWTGRDYLLVAGSYNAEGTSRLYRWDGRSNTPEPIRDLSFEKFNPEAVLIDPKNSERVLVLSDDGTLQVQGIDCKEVLDPNQRRFRSRWVTLPEGG